MRRSTIKRCNECRRLKQEYARNTSCDRCRRLKLSYQFNKRFQRRPVSQPHISTQDEGSPSDDVSGFLQVERIKALEYIVKRYTGLEQFSLRDLETVIADISSNEEVLLKGGENEDDDSNKSTDTTLTANSDLSNEDLLFLLSGKPESELNDSESKVSSTDTAVGETGNFLYAIRQETAIIEAVSLFPAAPSALVLIRVFFEFAQANYFYVDEEILRQRLAQFYSYNRQVGDEDKPWMSVALMMFALGIQFSKHYQSSAHSSCRELMRDAHDICKTMDDTAALTLYENARRLIPDILSANCIESVQAFLLFGLYTLPTDPAGLSLTYFGLAIRLATQLKLHHRNTQSVSPREYEVQKRVWWTVYALERRICILHGRPISISRADIDVDTPVDMEDLQPKERINTFQNSMAMLKLTIFMEDVRDATGHKMRKAQAIRNILLLRERIHSYWESLAEQTFCRDMTPGKPLFLHNVHLALNYYLLHVLLGRELMVHGPNIDKNFTSNAEWAKLRKEIASASIDSAVAIIDLCQMLRRHNCLSELSYTEFGSCYTSVLTLITRCGSDSNDKLRDFCEKGIEIIRDISGVSTTNGEKYTMERLETAFDRTNHEKRNIFRDLDEDGYNQFRKWAASHQSKHESTT
ncbi:hypothetical protein FIE12Z_7580 [Fusarium flagelliforme]|uniref:Xylanolytic transcriptional activator regulatory domain-containing protein n=1 Tax=Fusarium flagelliforme TaxID=2675880 RepID=A0A395MM07_9HYPO|nr:hypothetical protein FIE12Z_7580 [Fusarium flagelliforme]